MTEVTSDTVGILMGITTMWFIISMITYLWHRDEYGGTQVWKVLSYFNLMKLVRAIFLSLTAPIRIPYRFIKNETIFYFMDSLEREIWERNQSIKELEDTKEKLAELKRVKEREDKLARYIEKEKDGLEEEEEKEQVLRNGKWEPRSNWTICPFCENSFMTGDDHSCEKAQKTSECPSCHHNSLVVVYPGYLIRIKECLNCGHKDLRGLEES